MEIRTVDSHRLVGYKAKENDEKVLALVNKTGELMGTIPIDLLIKNFEEGPYLIIMENTKRK